MVPDPKGCPQHVPFYVGLLFKLLITGGVMFVAGVIATIDEPASRYPRWERAKAIGGIMAAVAAFGLVWSC